MSFQNDWNFVFSQSIVNQLNNHFGIFPGSFYIKYPIHRKLISINKIYTGRDNKEYNLRHDWNSLLSDDDRMLFKQFSRQMFPPADVMVTFVSINCFISHLFLIFNEGKDILNDD